MTKDDYPVSRSINVVVAVVTYGDGKRFDHLEQCVASARKTGADVVVIANGASIEYERELAALANADTGVRVESLPENRGSAGGFGEALRLALNTHPGATHILLLDDDDVLEPSAIDEATRLSADASNRLGPAVVSITKWRATSDQPDDAPVMRRSSFLNFDLSQAISRKILRKLGKPEDQPPTELQFAPYGGLLLPRSAAQYIVDRPGPDYVLYEDDIERTFALHSAGYRLIHSKTAIMRDLTASWLQSQAKPVSRWKALATGSADFRSYYYVRNRAHFERHYWCRSRVRYHVNRLFMLAYLRMETAKQGNAEQFAHLYAALRDGETGNLGLNPRFPLP